MTRLFIENFEVDLTEGFSHQVTYAIDDLNNFDSKATNFTKTLVIPGTSNNNQIFGNIFEFTNSNFHNFNDPNVGYNFNASKSAKARIEVNGLQVLKGVLRLLEVIVDNGYVEYEVAIFGELGGFINKLGAKKITGNDNVIDDLDFSEYNHTYEINSILRSWEERTTYNLNGTFTTGTNRILVNNKALRLLRVGDFIEIGGTTNNNGVYEIASIVVSGIVFNRQTEIFVVESLTNETSNFTLAFDTPRGEGYCYPLIDYGNVSYSIIQGATTVSTAKKDYQYTAFRPAIYLREYMDKIITGAGYTWESDFFNTDFFKRLVVPNNAKGLLKKGATDYINAEVTATQTLTSGLGTRYMYVAYPTNTLNQFTGVWNGENFNGDNEFTYTGVSRLNVVLTGNFQGTFLKDYVNDVLVIRMYRYRNGVDTEFARYEFPVSNGTESFDFNISGTLEIENGDIIQVKVDAGGLFNGNSTYPQLSITSSNILLQNDPPEWIDYAIGDEIVLNDTLPKNILQKDFFVSVVKMFNLLVTEDKYKERHLKIEPWVDFFQLGNYNDWSDKVDRSKPIKIKPMSEINARYYELKYKSDTDYYNDKYRKQYNEGYGDRKFDNELEFAKETETAEVIFSATPLVGYEGQDKIVSAIFKQNNDVEERIEHNLRVLQVKRITDVSSWKILNNTNTLATRTDYLYAGHLDDPDLPNADLNFGVPKELYFALVSGALSNNVFNAYYSPYMAEITDKDSRLVTCKMKFNVVDIFNLDFSRLIYIDGALYRLIRIVDYVEDDICEVQLLRVIYSTYEIGETTYEVGQSYGGGVIGYVDETGQHGIIILESTLTDIATYTWSSDSPALPTGAIGSQYGDATNNNYLIIQGTTNSQAEDIDAYTDGGYSDWLLPSLGDMVKINENINYFESTYGNISGNDWMTSTEYDTDNYWRILMGDGDFTTYVKNNPKEYRMVIRYF